MLEPEPTAESNEIQAYYEVDDASETSIENSVATEPASSAATAGNPNSPTLSKAGLINGLTIDVSKLTSDFIDLGKASDMDGDSVSISYAIDPSTSLITFDSSSNVIDLYLEKLFE